MNDHTHDIGNATVRSFGTDFNVRVSVSYPGYVNGGGLAVRLYDAEDGSQHATLSVNIPEANEVLGDNEFFAKLWFENEHLREPLLASDMFEDTGKRLPINHEVAEVWRIVTPRWTGLKAAA